jgi:hypothetical protein
MGKLVTDPSLNSSELRLQEHMNSHIPEILQSSQDSFLKVAFLVLKWACLIEKTGCEIGLNATSVLELARNENLGAGAELVTLTTVLSRFVCRTVF